MDGRVESCRLVFPISTQNLYALVEVLSCQRGYCCQCSILFIPLWKCSSFLFCWLYMSLSSKIRVSRIRYVCQLATCFCKYNPIGQPWSFISVLHITAFACHSGKIESQQRLSGLQLPETCTALALIEKVCWPLFWHIERLLKARVMFYCFWVQPQCWYLF